MRIVVLVKPGGSLEESDACAVEQAMRVARRRIDVNVSVLAAGGEVERHALRGALALGADDGAHVLDDDLATGDVLALSRVHAAALRCLGFDLVVCAAMSEAPNLSAIPPMLAERLGVPLLAFADSVAVVGGRDGDEAVAVCDEDRLLVERAVRLPAVVSVTDCAVAPRYPTFPAVAEARRKIVRTLTVGGLGIDPAGVRRTAARTVVGGSVMCARTRARVITAENGNPSVAAALLADFLTERRFIEG